MKNRSKDELLDSIDLEYSWRFREIVSIKTEVQSMKPTNKNFAAFIRSLVVLSYSHWEGFVKYATKYFLDYLKRLGLDKTQTNPALVASSLNYSLWNRGRADSNRIICSLLTDDHYKPQYNIEAMVDPKSNLNYEVLEIIATNIGINLSSLTLKRRQLDEIVLGRRNKMAHGDRDSLDLEYGIEVADASLDFMREFKNLLQNMIISDGFKKP